MWLSELFADFNPARGLTDSAELVSSFTALTLKEDYMKSTKQGGKMLNIYP